MHYFGTDYTSAISGNKMLAAWAIIVQININAVVKGVFPL